MGVRIGNPLETLKNIEKRNIDQKKQIEALALKSLEMRRLLNETAEKFRNGL